MAEKARMIVAQQALQMPEILSIILTSIYTDLETSGDGLDCEDDLSLHSLDERNSHLLRCGLVNKLWFLEAMPLLWSNPTLQPPWTRTTLSQHLAKIDPSRRQIYANLVEEAVLSTFRSERISESEAVFQGLKFPHLRTIEVSLSDLKNGFNVPGIENLGIKSLRIFPVLSDLLYSWRPWQDNPEAILLLMQIPNIFASIKELVFVTQGHLSTWELEQFVEGLRRAGYFQNISIIVDN